MAFTITINGIVYTEANFEGLAYVDDDTGFPAFVQDLAAHAGNAWRGVSGSSHDETISSKVFALSSGRAFADGAPVVIISSDGLVTLLGNVTSYDDTAPSVTVNVASASGTGTKTLWNIHVAYWELSTISNPATAAQGGWGVDMAASPNTGIAGFQLVKRYLVESILDTPPGSPVSNGYYLVAGTATGAWATHEDEVAREDGGGGYTFEAPGEGDLLFDKATKRYLSFLATPSYRAPWSGSEWEYLASAETVEQSVISVTSTLTVADLLSGGTTARLIHLAAGGGSVVVTLPDPDDAGAHGKVVHFRRGASDTGTVSINVSGAENINGGASLAVATGDRYSVGCTLLPGIKGWWTF